MSVIDLFTRKPKVVAKPYFERITECYQTMLDSDKKCSCEYCTMNDNLSDKLTVICKWLVLDYQQKHGLTATNGDILNTMTQAFLKLEANFKVKQLKLEDPIDPNKL